MPRTESGFYSPTASYCSITQAKRCYGCISPTKGCRPVRGWRSRGCGDPARSRSLCNAGSLRSSPRTRGVVERRGSSSGRAGPRGLTPQPGIERWNEGLDNIEAFLLHYARYFLDADVYNALKHGLVVRPGDSLTQLDDGELIKAQGPALEYLSQRKDASGRLRWNRSTRWLEFDRSLVFVFMATRLMESLWSIARARYLGD